MEWSEVEPVRLKLLVCADSKEVIGETMKLEEQMLLKKCVALLQFGGD